MQPVICAFPVFAVAVIFRLWQVYRDVLLARERRLRERVVYMLWVMANQVEGVASPLTRSMRRSGSGSRDCPRVAM